MSGYPEHRLRELSSRDNLRSDNEASHSYDDFVFNSAIADSTTHLNTAIPSSSSKLNNTENSTDLKLSNIESVDSQNSNPFDSRRNSVNSTNNPFHDSNRIIQDSDSDFTRVNVNQPNTVFPHRPLPPTPLYADVPVTNRTGLPLMDDEPLPTKKERSHKLINFKTLPYFTYSVTLIQTIVFIVELAKMANLTGSAFQTKPYFNPMLGPSTYVLINMGARFVPCMIEVPGFTNITTLQLPCPNSTSTGTDVCSLPQLCGLSGISTINSDDNSSIYDPKQWYRIFIPIFLHAGFLHIIFNFLLQLSMGAEIERRIGILRFAIIYIASGISGFLLGANFSPKGMASTGASGSLFGVIAVNLMIFLLAGKTSKNVYNTRHYKTTLFMLLAEIVVSLVLGLLPGLDNFSHIGGFVMGVLLGVLLLHDPPFIYHNKVDTDEIPLSTYKQEGEGGNFLEKFNYQERINRRIRPRFFLWCALRFLCLVLAISYYVTLAENFFVHGGGHCSWCKYINCLPVNDWCSSGDLEVSQNTTPSSSSTSPTPASSLLYNSVAPSVDASVSLAIPSKSITVGPTGTNTGTNTATTTLPDAINNPNTDVPTVTDSSSGSASTDPNDSDKQVVDLKSNLAKNSQGEIGIALYGVMSMMSWRYLRYQDLL